MSNSNSVLVNRLKKHQRALKQCTKCPGMQGPPVTGEAVASAVLLIGQAPGPREIEVRRPFAWTAGKTLFKWFAETGLQENEFRRLVYMSAVCRCFPGKNPKGGDRVPGVDEIANCSSWLQQEISLLAPQLIIPVGKLAISQLMNFSKLSEVIGHIHTLEIDNRLTDIIPLPHPSGASTWHRTEPGKTLLGDALRVMALHPAWKQILNSHNQEENFGKTRQLRTDLS
jgi:uracil-DNA glycosylase